LDYGWTLSEAHPRVDPRRHTWLLDQSMLT
jgi:hypothetical protein